MLAIYKREVRSYFNSMIGCVFAAFLTIIGGVYFMAVSYTHLQKKKKIRPENFLLFLFIFL